MKSGSVRAALIIAVIVVCSALAGFALDRVVTQRMARHRPPGAGGPGRGSPEADTKRRNDMLDRMTTQLTLSASQRLGLDSVMKRTDSSLRAIRSEMQPRLQKVFEGSRAEMEARLDSAQRIKFHAMQPQPRDRRP
ncbi:MAG: hypothetical protein M3Z05_14980 [Gemmatimonadota bacterium]|nr:hypothetical protein [Gemmatimonadota bacterium]